MGLSDSQEDFELSMPVPALPLVCLVLPQQAFCHDLQFALHHQGLAVSAYANAGSLFAAREPEEIDCLVLSTSGDEQGDGVRLLEKLQAAAQFIPTVMIATDPQVVHAVRAMQALAVECFDQHTPLPILVKTIRNLALSVAAQRKAVAPS